VSLSNWFGFLPGVLVRFGTILEKFAANQREPATFHVADTIERFK
jgi:hypothetical protein